MKVLRIVVVAMVAVAVGVVGCFECTYRLVLRSLVLPSWRVESVPVEAKQAAWARLGGRSVPYVVPLYPWNAGHYWAAERTDDRLAWAVVRSHLGEEREGGRVHGMAQWHAKGMALVVWVTRH